MPAAEEAASIPSRPPGPRAVRARLLTVALVVLVGACGGATKFDDEVSAVGDGTSVPTTGTTLPAATSGSTTTQTTTAAASRRPSTSAAGQARSAPRTAATRAPAPAPNPSELAILRAANGPPGAAAGIILQPSPARSLVVEVLEQPGAAANRPALDRVMADLRRYSGKPVSEVHTPLPGGSPSRSWTEPELEALADRSARVGRGPDRFVLRMVFVRGQNARSGSILAVTFRGDTFAAFPDRYGSAGQQVITTVTVHEVGHLLGLVDLYLDRGRADTRNDPARGGHSSNPGSVMYYAVDPSLLGSLFGGASDRFDARDEQDLAAIRAGARFGSNP
ncbi:MAG: hypothetical protein AVDCRST_MAG76-1194 [uncultured Acidimicrobiales bacterium]|uniref:Peptidase M10 metallopeptidase domain-containing protein n=1 Tax=uncultured Acidimicrobiales bacterium TaxID=310071 RepID=A0A6J4HRP5_9ACTN|nr:MAG: hypothetical protein AVDCRST_MAG76-1194 [uncultured Acidimicrobiales bacterium]